MIILSVDYGDKRTGIAVCDKFEMLASPVCVITEWNIDSLANKIIDVAKEKRAEEKLFSYHQEKILDSSEKKELWFESEKNYASWESNGFLGAQYDINWYNFSDYELYNWEIKIVIPEKMFVKIY